MNEFILKSDSLHRLSKERADEHQRLYDVMRTSAYKRRHKAKLPRFVKDQLVLYYAGDRYVGSLTKLVRQLEGPFIIEDVTEDGISYKIRHLEVPKIRFMAHVTKLHKFIDRRGMYSPDCCGL